MQLLQNKFAFISGASRGIGHETAKVLAQNGANLILLARTSEKLLSLKAELEEKYNISVAVFPADVTDHNKIKQLFEENISLFNKIDIIINNAGTGMLSGLFQDTSFEDCKKLLETNLISVLNITHLLLPSFINKKNGHIVNIGSVASRWNFPKNLAYNISKHAVLSFSENLRLDLIGTNIRVTTIEPGAVKTDLTGIGRFGNEQKAEIFYRGSKLLEPLDVANSILWCLLQPQHVNIQELVLFPTDQAGVGHLHRNI